MEPVSSPELSTRRRRWFGSICLLLAIGMLVLDQIALKGRLGPVPFLIYWLVCFLLTMLAIFIALVDLRAMRIKTRNEQQDLMLETLRDVERKKQERRQDSQNGHP